MDELFAPPAYEWRRLSPKYRSLLRLTTLIVLPTISTVAAIVVGILTGSWGVAFAIVAVGAALTALRCLLVDRNWRSWGYVEREDDLYITHGVLFKTLVAVPYGRMQLVEVQSGPLERAFGVATVRLHTASAGTDATIPGLPPEEATRLRDRLTELGESQASGL
jgi:membrane protein YdbS with pleckstrin-like domain